MQVVYLKIDFAYIIVSSEIVTGETVSFRCSVAYVKVYIVLYSARICIHVFIADGSVLLYCVVFFSFATVSDLMPHQYIAHFNEPG